jgi:translocation and assembly module TamB
VTVVGPVVHLGVRSDGRWNFEEVFARRGGESDADSVTAEGTPGRRVVLRDVTIRSGDVTLSAPWDSTRSDSTRWLLAREPGGWRRLFRFERVNARLSVARVVAPRDVDRLFQLVQLSCRARIIGEPFEVEQLRADISVEGNRLYFDVWEGDLAASTLFGQGWVSLKRHPDFEFTLRGSPLMAADVRWLLPWLPAGAASLDFHMRSLPDGVAFEIGDARWESPAARLAGHFGMSLSDAGGLAFQGVDLQVERLHTSLLGPLTGWEPPLAGALAGDVVLDGPLSDLQVEADIRLVPDVPSPRSRVTVRGAVGVGKAAGTLTAGSLEVGFDTLQMEVVRALVPAVAVEGQLTGRARLDGRLSESLAVEIDVEQRDGQLVPSRFRGGGTLSLLAGRSLRLDVSLYGEPLSLTTLAAYYPQVPVRGVFASEFRVRGALDDLALEARLIGAGDSLTCSARVELDGRPKYRAAVQGWRVELPEFRAGLAESDIDFRIELEGEGARLEDLSGQVRASLFASFIGGVRFESGLAALRFADGRLRVDSALFRGEFGEVFAAGGLGLRAGSEDSLDFVLAVDSLGGLNPWLLPSNVRLTRPVTEEATGDAQDAEHLPVDGSVRVSGRLVGALGDLDLHGRALGHGLRFAEWGADTLELPEFAVRGLGGELTMTGDARARGLGYAQFRFERVAVSVEYTDTVAAFDFDIARNGAAAKGRLWLSFAGDPRSVGLDALDLQLGSTTWRLDEPARLRLAGSGALAVESFRLVSGDGHVSLHGSVAASGPVSLAADVAGFRLAEVTRLWPDGMDLAGTLELHAQVTGKTSAPELQANIEVVDGRVLAVPFSNLRGEMGLRGGDLSVNLSMWRGLGRLFRLSGRLPFDLALPEFHVSFPSRPLRLVLEGDSVPLSLASLISEQIADPWGYARAAVTIGGQPDEITLAGPLTVVDGGFRLVWTGTAYEGLEGRGRFEGQDLVLDALSLRGVAGGSAQVTGRIDLSRPRDPGFDLRLQGDGLPIYDQLDARLVVSGAAELRGHYEQPTVTGQLSIVNGVLYMDEIGRRSEIIDPFEEGLALLDSLFGADGPGRRTRNVFLDNLTMDLGVNVEREAFLRSLEANVEIAGNLVVRMRPGQREWRIDGTLQALRGDYRIFNKRFQVVEGTIEFVGMPAMNPNLRIVAIYTLRTQKEPIDIRLIIGGTLEDMRLTLESDAQPPIPESDLLSYLMFGRPAYELTRSSEERGVLQDVAAGVPHALAGYALGSLLVGQTGIAYIDVSRVNVQAGAQGEYQEGVGPAAITATQVEVGWYLAPTVFVSVAQHLAGAVRPTVRLEWRLTDRFTLRGVTQPRFGEAGRLIFEVPGANVEQSIGLFLFYGWTY